MTIENLRAATAALRTVSDRPFNLDFFSQAKPKTEAAVHERTRQRLQPRYSALGLDAPPRELPDLAPAFDDDWLSLLLELRPAVVRFHFDVPGAAAIAALRSAGIILISTATTVAEAPLLEVVRLDAVIAQGWEAGGGGSRRSLLWGLRRADRHWISVLSRGWNRRPPAGIAGQSQRYRYDGDRRFFRPVGARDAIPVRRSNGKVVRTFAGLPADVRAERAASGCGAG